MTKVCNKINYLLIIIRILNFYYDKNVIINNYDLLIFINHLFKNENKEKLIPDISKNCSRM